MTFNNEEHRFGSATPADTSDIQAIGMFRQEPNSLLVGFHGNRPLWYSGMGGLLLTAGARSGKMRDILAYNLCSGICASTIVMLDVKGEGAAISQDQTPDGKFCAYWNPRGMHGLPKHRINPVDYIQIESSSIVSDTKVFCDNTLPLSGSSNASFFERRAQEIAEAIILVIAERDGVVTLPEFYRVLNALPANGDEWLNFAYDMSRSRFPIAQRIEEEIAAAQADSSGGFKGILGELFKGFASLSDPVLLESVSPPYDLSLSQLCEHDQRWQLYLMPPEECISPWSSVIKSLLVSAMIYKSRAPQAPQQTWILDECALLGKFPLAVKLYSYGAGIGIRPFGIFQSSKQMNVIQDDAETIITASAAIRSYFSVRDVTTATTLSRMIGTQTLAFEDEHKIAQARHAKRQAMQEFISGGDPLTASLNYAHFKKEAETPHLQQRWMRTTDEVMNTPADKQYIFADGLPGVLYADRKPYYEQRFMDGRFHPNPFYAPAGKVRVKSRFGHAWRNVVQMPVPPEYAHYPQYKDGVYSCIR